jgi:hypothetical protein
MAVIRAGTFVVTLDTASVSLDRASRMSHTKIREIAAFRNVLAVFTDGNRSKPGCIGKCILNRLQFSHVHKIF